jgi:steroid delta-isomerase-like uncharacterized protein
MTEAERVWKGYIDAWNTHHVDSILSVVAEQFIYDERPMTMRVPLQGREAFRKYLEGVFRRFSEFRIETLLCEAGSTVGIAESLMSGTYARPLGVPLGNGRRISVRVACVFEVTHGRLVHERLYWDRANTMRQLGLLASMASAATLRAVRFP